MKMLIKAAVPHNSSLYVWLRRQLTKIRAARKGLRHVHPSAYISASCSLARDIEIAPFAYIGPDCRVGPKVRIGKYSMFGPGVCVVGDDHRYDLVGTPIIFSGRPVLRETVIGADVWIGCNAIILAGRSIGCGAIVAAGAVVTEDVGEYSVVAGVPARIIGQRFSSSEERARHNQMLSMDLPRGQFCA